MRIDLHTQTRVSDATASPAELVRAAVAAGLDVLVLTDHDTANGWPEATATAEAAGPTFVPGIEVSTRHQVAACTSWLILRTRPTHRWWSTLTRSWTGQARVGVDERGDHRGAV